MDMLEFLTLVCRVAGLGEVLLVAFLTEYLILLKDEGCVLKSFLAVLAHKVLGVPHLTQGTSKRTPGEDHRKEIVKDQGKEPRQSK